MAPERLVPELLEPGCLESGHPRLWPAGPAPKDSGDESLLHDHGVLEWTSPAGQIHRTYPQEHHHPVPERAPYFLAVPAPPCAPRAAPRPGPADDPPPF